MTLRTLAAAALLCASLATPARAQTPVPPPSAPPAAAERADAPARVFLDCQAWGACDFDFFRTEIAFVDYVRDRADADVHVLVTAQETGGGGRELTVALLGQRRFAGRSQTLRYNAAADETEDEVRRGMARLLKVGLLPYAAETGVAPRLEVTYTAPEAAEGAGEAGRDPWNLWSFTVSGNGWANGEDSYKSFDWSAGTSASRVTERLKVTLSARANGSRSEFDLGERTVVNRQRYRNLNALVVHSLGGQWSAGARASVYASTYDNTDLSVRLAPALEYSFYPYAEATTRQVTLQYTVGVRRVEYDETTLFGEDRETLPDHKLTLAADLKQPWGSVDASLSGSQYLHDLARNRMEIGGGVELRLFRGLSLRLSGQGQRIRDQLSIPGGDLTEEEILLRQRALATGFQYFASFGLSYRFGTKLNNVVNPRFDEGGFFF